MNWDAPRPWKLTFVSPDCGGQIQVPVVRDREGREVAGSRDAFGIRGPSSVVDVEQLIEIVNSEAELCEACEAFLAAMRSTVAEENLHLHLVALEKVKKALGVED